MSPRLTVDRLEADLAVLEHGGVFFNVPRSALPEGAHEGMVLELREALVEPAVFGGDAGEPVPEEEARLREATERLKRLAARSADLPDEIEL
ncbi:DUF3006 domain-containing protein [Myxococcota bacterium]|nr:DUF3006 domain-containing protein [Myxococcota bacterium]